MPFTNFKSKCILKLHTMLFSEHLVSVYLKLVLLPSYVITNDVVIGLIVCMKTHHNKDENDCIKRNLNQLFVNYL